MASEGDGVGPENVAYWRVPPTMAEGDSQVTLNPKPQTPNPKPQTPNPMRNLSSEPQTLNINVQPYTLRLTPLKPARPQHGGVRQLGNSCSRPHTPDPKP